MKSKTILIALLFVLGGLVFPNEPVKAATPLKEIELTDSYYVSDAVLYKDKAFLIGGERVANYADTKIQIAVTDGDRIDVIIPASEFNKVVSEGPNPYIFGETDRELFIGIDGDGYNLSTVYVIDKDTENYEKLTADEFHNPYRAMLEENGYDSEVYSLDYSTNRESGDVWAVAYKSSEYSYELEEEVPGHAIVLNNNHGVIKYYEDLKIPYNGSYFYAAQISYKITSDKDGNFYFVNDFGSENYFVKLNVNGSDTKYSYPKEYRFSFDELIVNGPILYADYSKVNENNRTSDFTGVFKMVDGQLQQLKSSSPQLFSMVLDTNGNLWHSGWVDNTIGWAFGFLDGTSHNATNVFLRPGVSYFDVYDNTLFVYSVDGFAFVDVPTASAEKSGWEAVNGSWYFYKDGVKQTGWVNDRGTWYFLDGNGAMKTGWLSDGGTWYFLDGSGAMKTGWLYNGGTWYFLEGSGAMKKGWLYNGGTWYFFENSGAMKKGWLYNGGTWYFFEGSGAMKKGWLNSAGTWYFFEGSGAMKTGWASIGGTWYYFNGSGAMKTGWLSNGSTWYFLDNNGAMKTGWVSTGGKWYYFYNSGAMASNTTIGGYRFGTDGAWIH
ncbi:hypothetical protein V7112_15555 [Bacillus sp. JJ1566]|uniref:hypothetical protein n=1 Tax=Bacillus sp. JJ1566 TaxID=3122961 RepID=UPI002FFF4758